jgi:hypothetical protein
MDDTDIESVPVTPIPPPPSDAPINSLSYKLRVEGLQERLANWLAKNDQDQPPYEKSEATEEEKYQANLRVKDFWAKETEDYKKQFGPEISLLASQLRKCGDFHNQVRDIRWRLGFEAQSHGSVSSTLMDLSFIAESLPDDDSKLSCADGKD